MGQPLPLRQDDDASRLRRLARHSTDSNQTRRLLALAVIYDGGSRSEAARRWSSSCLSATLRKHGDRTLTARPRHHGQNGHAIDTFKKNFPAEIASLQAGICPTGNPVAG